MCVVEMAAVAFAFTSAMAVGSGSVDCGDDSRVAEVGLATVGVIALACGVTTVVFNSSRPVLDRNFWTTPREMQYLTLHDSDLKEPLRDWRISSLHRSVRA